MKNFFTCFIVFLLFVPFATRAQDKDDQLIEWSPARKLTWDDYKGKPNPASEAAASTTTHLGIEYNMRNNGFSYAITSKFSQTRSWGRHKNEYILAHEQGHFDIAEIFARKLHKELQGYQFNKNSYKTDLAKIYDTILDEKESMQNSYDEQTNHSINKEKQAEWIKKIANMLEGLNKYADYATH